MSYTKLTALVLIGQQKAACICEVPECRPSSGHDRMPPFTFRTLTICFAHVASLLVNSIVSHAMQDMHTCRVSLGHT